MRTHFEPIFQCGLCPFFEPNLNQNLNQLFSVASVPSSRRRATSPPIWTLLISNRWRCSKPTNKPNKQTNNKTNQTNKHKWKLKIFLQKSKRQLNLSSYHAPPPIHFPSQRLKNWSRCFPANNVTSQLLARRNCRNTRKLHASNLFACAVRQVRSSRTRRN